MVEETFLGTKLSLPVDGLPLVAHGEALGIETALPSDGIAASNISRASLAGDSRPAKSPPDWHSGRAPGALPKAEGPMQKHGDRNAGGVANHRPPFVPLSLTLYTVKLAIGPRLPPRRPMILL